MKTGTALRAVPALALAASLCGGAATAQDVPPISTVTQLVDSLRSDSASVRLAAVEGLAHQPAHAIGLPATAAVPALLAVLEGDPDAAVCEMAAVALAEIGAGVRGGIDFVESRLDAWRAAGAPADAIDAIGKALADLDAWPGDAIAPFVARIARTPGCARGALPALGALGGTTAAKALDNWLAAEDPELRWRALFAAAWCRAEERAGMRTALAHANPAVRLWGVRALRAGGVSTAPLAPAILPWLSDARPLVRRWALHRARELGAHAAPAAIELARQLRFAGDDTALALASLGARAAPAVPTLLARLEQGDGYLRAAAIEALGAIGPAADAGFEVLLQLATRPHTDDPIATHVVESEAYLAIAALARIAPERTARALVDGVSTAPDDPFPATWYRVWRFRALGPAAVHVLPQLVEMLDGDDRIAHGRALLVLAEVGAPAAPALPSIARLLGSGDEYVRDRALDVAFAIGPAAAERVRPQLERLWQTGGRTRSTIAQGLHRFGDACAPWLLQALRDGDRWVRDAAARSLLRIAADSPATLAALGEAFDAAPSDVQAELLFVGAAPHGPFTPTAQQIQRALASPSLELRDRCVGAVWQAHDPEGRASGDFDTLRWAWGFHERSAEELAALAEPARLTAWTASFAGDPDPARRAMAANALGVPGCRAAIDTAIAALATLAADPDAGVRARALASLAEHGIAARAARAPIAAAWHDRDHAVREAAARALRACRPASGD